MRKRKILENEGDEVEEEKNESRRHGPEEPVIPPVDAEQRKTMRATANLTSNKKRPVRFEAAPPPEPDRPSKGHHELSVMSGHFLQPATSTQRHPLGLKVTASDGDPTPLVPIPDHVAVGVRAAMLSSRRLVEEADILYYDALVKKKRTIC